jgi:ComEC/Rec2-related protein
LTGGPELKFGDHIRVRGVAVPVGVSEELIAKQLGRGTIKAGPGDVTVDGTGGWVSRIAEGWRTSFQEFANRSLGPEPAATVIASVFGVDDVSPAFTQRLRAAGAISLASVSGLQVLLLGGLVAWATVRLPISRATALLLLAGLLMVYVTASGLHAGAIRASLMTLMISAAYLLRRSSDVVSALSLSALLELLWRPAWAYDFGFQMSFVVVGVLALWLPHRSRLMGKSVLVKSGIGAGSIILMFVAAAPLIAYQTGKIGFGSPLTGALIVPAIAPMFVLAISGWLVSFASMSLAAVWMRWLVAPFAGWILACADLASRWAGLGVQVPAFSAYVLVPVYLLFALGGRITSNAFSGERG